MLDRVYVDKRWVCYIEQTPVDLQLARPPLLYNLEMEALSNVRICL